MNQNIPEESLQEMLDLNEYGFYYFMPDSELINNDLGYFVKNKTIETYSYITPKKLGSEKFDEFLDFAFSFFSDGKEYIIVKHSLDENYRTNSKKLREKKFIPYHLDIGLLHWNKDKENLLKPFSYVELDLLSPKKINKWVDVFFDAFVYPRSLRKYITRMTTNQAEMGIEFYIGYVSGRDVSCFCSYDDGTFKGIYGVGTRTRYRRRGYATILMSNYIKDIISSNPSAKFCLQVQKNSGADDLYSKIGFEEAVTQKRFDWNPSITGFLI